MKMIFKSHQSEKVGLYQSILESAGIPTTVRNEFVNAASGTWLADPDTPELWTLNDEDYERALAELRVHEHP
ncbi:DUF2007 domain-containing protein [Luteolibacter arcticus]|uniref:DUF2007 domain-containing protein n=1 Tax=Luteolibacter arcticus TaxID=1581411 RepID=A0ABT3GRU3_9BACT|nr:DUF2007 domain-containing protein [Luteolibacter arcticus]MCW1926247.1 DUF2007 domain-containing protein [Luteolibacter arcticus]